MSIRVRQIYIITIKGGYRLIAKSLANRKKQTLINNEYYNMQQKFDTLYKYRNEGRNFYKLFDMIVYKNNIKLAYRNIQNNKGANTPGVDGLTHKRNSSRRYT